MTGFPPTLQAHRLELEGVRRGLTCRSVCIGLASAAAGDSRRRPLLGGCLDAIGEARAVTEEGRRRGLARSKEKGAATGDSRCRSRERTATVSASMPGNGPEEHRRCLLWVRGHLNERREKI